MRLLSVFTIIVGISAVVNAYNGGTGEPGDPYKIANTNDWLHLMRDANDWSRNFLLTSDLNLQGITITPIGNYNIQFTGTLDGSDHLIRNVLINLPSTDEVGLFGNIGTTGQIKNLGLENFNVTGNTSVGALVGYNYGLITRCHSTASVHGSRDNVGGLVGNDDHGTISYCYSNSTVTGNMRLGALVGQGSYSNISYCYSTGSASGFAQVGGLAGKQIYGTIAYCYSHASAAATNGYAYTGGFIGTAAGNINSCYSTGRVTGSDYIGGFIGFAAGSCIVTDSYYDAASANCWTSAGGFISSTYQMVRRASYQNWDFTSTWRMCTDGVDYPHLAWEYAAHGDLACPDGVNFTDFAVLANSWLSTSTQSNWNSLCDISSPPDSKIDSRDLLTLAHNWLSTTTP